MTGILTMMTDFSKKGVAFALMILLFPVLWPIYAVYNLSLQKHVTHYDCSEARTLWVMGTICYVAICFVLCFACLVVITLYNTGYLVHVLICLGAAFAIFIAPDVLYYIFKIIKK